MGKFLAHSGINAKQTWESKSNRKQTFLLAMSYALMRGWRNACSSSGVSEIEESSSINGGLQSVSALAVQLRHFSSSLLPVSKSLWSVCVLPCRGSVGVVRVWIHWRVFFSSSGSLLPHSLPLQTHLSYVSKEVDALICLVFFLIYSNASWEVCPEGVIAGVRPLPMHQQNRICTSPWKSYQLAVKLPYSFSRLVCGLGTKVEQLALLPLFFIRGGCQYWGWQSGSDGVRLSPTFCRKWDWYPWRPGERSGWSSSPATGLGWFGSNLLPPPADQAEDFSGPGTAFVWGVLMSPQRSLPCPAVLARAWWASR